MFLRLLSPSHQSSSLIPSRVHSSCICSSEHEKSDRQKFSQKKCSYASSTLIAYRKPVCFSVLSDDTQSLSPLATLIRRSIGTKTYLGASKMVHHSVSSFLRILWNVSKLAPFLGPVVEKAEEVLGPYVAMLLTVLSRKDHSIFAIAMSQVE